MLIQGDFLDLLKSNKELPELKGKVSLMITSPPFPLDNKKQYGNKKSKSDL